ncbi:hypothetical protein MRX96_016414 [Rhipicephalus microplus]
MKERLGKLSVRGTARFESTHAETERQRVLLHAGSECDVSALEAATKDGTGVTRKRLSIIANPIASRLLRRPRLSFASSTLIGVVAEEEAGKLTPPPPLPSHHPYPQSPHAISQRVPLRWCGSRCVSTGSRRRQLLRAADFNGAVSSAAVRTTRHDRKLRQLSLQPTPPSRVPIGEDRGPMALALVPTQRLSAPPRAGTALHGTPLDDDRVAAVRMLLTRPPPLLQP